MKKIIRMITGFVRHMSRTNVNAYAASAAFFIFLSLIPIIILLCSFLPYTPLQKSDLQIAVNEVMPLPMVSFMLPLIDSLYNSTVGVISLAAVVTVWSAGKGMLALMRGLNAMNGVVEDRNYVVQRILASFYTVIMLILLLVSLLLMVFGNTLVRVLSRYIPVLDELLSFLMLFKPLFSWGILTVAFMVMYAYVPNVKLKVKDQFPGALFSAIAWNLFSWGFSFYIETFNDFSVYGSLSAIVVIMLWMYTCMYLLLVGAHINRFVVPFRREVMKK
ncbi:MAG: YihY/virulence factor BrkB family protein [Eubacteriales bacterium]|nr:YihY/virulence factor BrkB family protein [Eubacteriales bacterium]